MVKNIWDPSRKAYFYRVDGAHRGLRRVYYAYEVPGARKEAKKLARRMECIVVRDVPHKLTGLVREHPTQFTGSGSTDM